MEVVEATAETVTASEEVMVTVLEDSAVDMEPAIAWASVAPEATVVTEVSVYRT